MRIIKLHGFSFTWEYIADLRKYGIHMSLINEAIESKIDHMSFKRDGFQYDMEFNYDNCTLNMKREALNAT